MKSKLPVPTADNINEAHRLARANAESAVQYAIQCGQLLAARKKELDHGDFQSWIEENCSFGWSTAKRYVAAARKNATGVAFDSLRHYFPSGQKPKAKAPPPVAEKPVGDSHQKATAVAFSVAPAAAADTFSPPEAQPAQPPAEQKEAPEAPRLSIVEPGFTEGVPDGYEPEEDEEYQERIERVMMADDKLAAMREELKKQQADIAQLKRSRDHYLNSQGEAVRLLKKEQAKVARLEKELARAQAA